MIKPSLYYSKQCLLRWSAMSRDATVNPAEGSLSSFFESGFFIVNGANDIVESHDYIGTNVILNVN
jgi:hypothetical protein